MTRSKLGAPRNGTRGTCVCGAGIVVVDGEWTHETDGRGRPLDAYRYACSPDGKPAGVARTR